MGEKIEVKEQNKKSRKGFIILLIIIIAIIAGLIFWKAYTDKSYELEEITQFSYFKLYEDEKYGVIDSKRKCFDRAKI